MDKSLTNIAVLVVVGVLAVAGGLYLYNHYVEPQSDGPMERAGEKIDDALDGK